MHSAPPPLTYLLFTHNEEQRVRQVLLAALPWADEILVFDKQSTDRTCSICAEFSPQVRVIEIPFSPLGEADLVSAVRLSKHDWVWVGTCSEIPTRKVVEHAKQLLAEKPELELVQVPRKIYSFGIDSADSPWGVRNYPFLIHKLRAQITNTIHNNFRAKNKELVGQIPFAEDCCVHHFTHATAKSYIHSMAQYMEVEGERPDQAELMQEAIKRLENRRDLGSLLGTDSFGLECGWRFYWLGTALHAWDKLRGVDVPQKYQQMRQQLLTNEWPQLHNNLQPTAPGSPPAAWPEISIQASQTSEFSRLPEDALLLELRGRPLSKLVKTLYQVGAHHFQEKALLFEIFPNLTRVVLFEPLPALYSQLCEQEKNDPRIVVLPYAVSDQDGETQFHVASNDGASSSLLPFGKHQNHFPKVRTEEVITVQTRTLATTLTTHQLPAPDFLLLDVQGAEYQILSSLNAPLRRQLRMIYTEASTEEIYLGSKTLDRVKELLAEDFAFAGYCPLKAEVPCHGNALFIHQSQAWLLLPPAPPVAVTDPPDQRSRNKGWAKFLRRAFSRKWRRSMRKRLASLSEALRD